MDEPLIGCNNNLVVLIQNTEATPLDWSFVYSLVTDVDITISATPSSHPIPFQTVATDYVQRNVDTIVITGVVGCYSCGAFRSDNTNIVIAGLKKLSEQSYYSKDKYLTLTSNDWTATNMVMTNASIKESQDSVMKKQIVTTWQQMNIVGSVTAPYFARGGIQY